MNLGNQNTFPNRNTNVFQQNAGILQQNRLLQQQNIQRQNQMLMQQINPSYSKEIPPDVLQDIWEMEREEQRNMQAKLPSFSAMPETKAYYQAFQKISDMLDNKQSLDLKRAVFLVENAYFNNKMSWEAFNKTIQDKVDLCKLILAKGKATPNSDMTKNMAIFQLMTDTLRIKNAGIEKTQVHLPYGYDFNDFAGNKDWSKQFVSKLLTTKKGQCHSLPLLYLILAQELGAKAYLSYAPEHTYVRIQDEEGFWYNVELTNQMLTSESFVLGSGFIKTEALRSGIYMDTINHKQQVANTLADLAQGYYRKFGYDEFVHQCVETTLKYQPNNIHAITIKADYYTLLFNYLAKKYQIKNKETLMKYPQAKQVLQMRNQLYQLIDGLGYESIPESAYQEWLKSLKMEENRQKHQELMKKIYINEKN
jgi:hypothetical protein